jgi:hypothetical protein
MIKGSDVGFEGNDTGIPDSMSLFTGFMQITDRSD